ncbi:hypothetical protein [Scytonema sp. NUACC26]|uniref:hypothetical protein n=1 Tax=Scytonema sp. NUACC26 TaxID=3140176 RepID=UPI0038B30FC6
MSNDTTCGFPEDRGNVNFILGGYDDNDTYTLYTGSPAIDGGTNDVRTQIGGH